MTPGITVGFQFGVLNPGSLCSPRSPREFRAQGPASEFVARNPVLSPYLGTSVVLCSLFWGGISLLEPNIREGFPEGLLANLDMEIAAVIHKEHGVLHTIP